VVRLGNKGYLAESYFEVIIQNILTKNAPMRYSEVWKRCSKAGIGSKQTLSKYLKRLEKAGVVLHDSGGYRISALSDDPKLSRLRQSLREPGKTWQYSRFAHAANISENQFLRMIEQEFDGVFHIYAWMLSKLVQTNNRTAAQELVGIFMRSQITSVLDELAKKIWLERENVQVDVLKEKKLVIVDR